MNSCQPYVWDTCLIEGVDLEVELLQMTFVTMKKVLHYYTVELVVPVENIKPEEEHQVI